jgi:glycosyltransferase involved in cell wall biosynthesis
MTRFADVTFVVPNYNGGVYLRQTLDSLLAQRAEGYGILVADNCSSDDSISIAREYGPRVAVALADRHVSMSENWNRAMAYVETPFFVFAHSDDLYDSEYLSVMLPLLRDRPDAFAAHCAVENVDESGRPLDLALDVYKSRFFPREDPYCRTPCDEASWLRQGNYILAPSAIYRTSLVRRIGIFNPRFQFVPDWEYWLRGVFAGFRIAGTRRRLVKYRRHASSLTRAAEKNLSRYEEELELLEWLGPAGRAAGCFADDRVDYGLVQNTIITELTDRLSRADVEGAVRLSRFARERIPGYRGSARDLAARAALPLGRTGGRLLGVARGAYLELLRWRQHR